MKIRKAKKEEAAALAPLITEAIEELVYRITAQSEAEAAEKQLICYLEAEENRFSYRNCFVAEECGTVCAMALCYCGEELERLDAPINRYLKERGVGALAVECEPHEMYVDSIAVEKSSRGKGIAAKLLDAVCEEAKRRGLPQVSLLVDEKKPRVQNLYERCGFCAEGDFLLAGHRYFRMVKKV